MEKLETKMQSIGEELDMALEEDDEEKADALQEEGDRVGQQLQALENAPGPSQTQISRMQPSGWPGLEGLKHELA